MELPVFALHTVLFPRGTATLRVFEPRYLALVDDVLPTGRFVVVAIRKGQEVGGDYEPNRVGVTVSIDAHVSDDDGTHLLRVTGRDRVALISRVRVDPYPVWHVEAFPDEGGAGTDDVQGAGEALLAYLEAAGGTRRRSAVPHDPVVASYVLAAAVPGSVPERQALLELPAAGERLHAVRAVFRRETALVRALGAGAGAPGLEVNPN
jgi:uncharacterized protein